MYSFYLLFYFRFFVLVLHCYCEITSEIVNVRNRGFFHNTCFKKKNNNNNLCLKYLGEMENFSQK